MHLNPHLRTLSTIPAKPLHWLWHNRIPRGKITLLAGDPGSGKTALTLDLAARLSRGESLHFTHLAPGESPGAVPQSTLLLSPEDNTADTLRPKLEAMAANLNHIHTLENFPSLLPNRAPGLPGETAPTPLDTLDSILASIPNLALLIIDPITHYLGLTDRKIPQPQALGFHATGNSILSALAHLAQKHNIAILLTTRLTKKIDPALTPATLHRTLGSCAFTSAARSVLLLTPHHSHSSPSVPECLGASVPSPNRLLLTLKSNLTTPPLPLPITIAQTLTYHPEQPLPKNTPTQKSPGPAALAAEAAADWLRKTLAQGPVPAASMLSDARANAISRSTLDRARHLAGIETLKQDYSSAWFWQLPNETRPLPENKIEKELSETLKKFERSLLNLNLEEELEDDEELEVDEEENEEQENDAERETSATPVPLAPEPEVLPQNTPISKTEPEALPQNQPIPTVAPHPKPQNPPPTSTPQFHRAAPAATITPPSVVLRGPS